MEKHEYIFELFAPYNNEAKLIGDFNDWREISMRKSDDGYFRATVEVADGVYQYRFNVQSKSWFYPENDWKTVTDPYATEVDSETQNSILKIKNGAKIIDEFEWKNNNTPLAENNKIVIYEMHIGDFSGGEHDPFERGKYP
ncbi:MAG: alpha-amylase, partial [Pyrinomonadaceae bacterium]